MPHRESSSRVDAREKLNACIRTLYEDTLVPVREIARLAGVSERNIYALVRRLGCRPRMRLPVPVRKRTNARASAVCRRAAERQRELAAAARAELERRTSARRARRARETNARTLALLAQTLRELALRIENLTRAAHTSVAPPANTADIQSARDAASVRIRLVSD